MPFQLLPASPSDALEISKILVACSNGARLRLESANVDPNEYADWHYQNIVDSLSVMHPDIVHLKLVDEETGRIAAFAQWGFTPDAWEIESKFKRPNPRRKGTNMALRTKYDAAMEAMEARSKPTENHYILMNMITSPSFRRRGAGRTLVSHGLEKADRDGVLTILAASPDGYLLYKTLGFEEVDRLEVDLREFGGEGVHVHVAMVRKPR